MRVTHEVREPWRSHLQSCQQRMRVLEANINRLKAELRDSEQDRAALKVEAGNIVVLMAQEADMPKGANYTLSDDGATISCEGPE